jgi:NAD(P)-dependent dehydrogenase (short-subunit alcohol dehydrogenase family)
MTDDERAAAVAAVSLGRIGTPADLGRAALFLAANDSADVADIQLCVDGGVTQI